MTLDTKIVGTMVVQSINQSINLSNNLSSNQSINQSINRCVFRCISIISIYICMYMYISIYLCMCTYIYMYVNIGPCRVPIISRKIWLRAWATGPKLSRRHTALTQSNAQITGSAVLAVSRGPPRQTGSLVPRIMRHRGALTVTCWRCVHPMWPGWTGRRKGFLAGKESASVTAAEPGEDSFLPR